MAQQLSFQLNARQLMPLIYSIAIAQYHTVIGHKDSNSNDNNLDLQSLFNLHPDDIEQVDEKEDLNDGPIFNNVLFEDWLKEYFGDSDIIDGLSENMRSKAREMYINLSHQKWLEDSLKPTDRPVVDDTQGYEEWMAKQQAKAPNKLLDQPQQPKAKPAKDTSKSKVDHASDAKMKKFLVKAQERFTRAFNEAYIDGGDRQTIMNKVHQAIDYSIIYQQGISSTDPKYHVSYEYCKNSEAYKVLINTLDQQDTSNKQQASQPPQNQIDLSHWKKNNSVQQKPVPNDDDDEEEENEEEMETHSKQKDEL